MKKLGIMAAAIVCLLAVGCGAKKEDYEKTMKEYATNYYETYMKGVTGVTAHSVTITMLKNANTNGKSNYDLKKLKNCKDESAVTMTLKDGKSEIEKYEFDMDCK